MTRVDMGGLDSNGLFQEGGRVVGFALRMTRHPQQVEHFGIGRVHGQDLAIQMLRVEHPPGSVACNSLVQRCRSVTHEALPNT